MDNQYENRTQLYSAANLKYPLDDFTEAEFPYNILVDAAFSVPDTLMNDMRLTAYVRKATYVFLCVEAGTVPIGHLYVINPEPYKIYPLTMRCPGTAWVVLGPASKQELDMPSLSIRIDDTCIMPNPSPSNRFRIKINGEEHPMPNIITVRTNNFLITGEEDRYTDWENPSTDPPVRALVLSRNDLNLDEKVVRTALTDIDTEHMPLTNVNGVTPDVNGNVEIRFKAEGVTAYNFDESSSSSESSNAFINAEPVAEVSLEPVVDTHTNKNIGFVLTTKYIEGCADPYKRLDSKIKAGKEGYGLPYDLPLDAYFESSSSSLSSESESSTSYSESSSSSNSSSSSSF